MVSPEALRVVIYRNVRLLRVHLCELGDRKAPRVRSRPEPDVSLERVHFHRHFDVFVRADYHVHALDYFPEILIRVFEVNFSLDENAVDFVEEEHRADSFGYCLPQHRLRLDAHALDAVDDDQRAVGDAQSGGHFGRKVDVARRVDEVDELGLSEKTYSCSFLFSSTYL
ncbi:hypothetical protein MHBO_000431 [Bonamia ostreae]|uniref:Uncharacterized protein n=1 Tax=Bonamia ostreae TaxID=126728 RepID=A0ABV2AFN3_9EUKA